MLRKIHLPIILVLLIVPVVFSYTVRVQPDKIVPNSINGKADDIQVSVLISVANVEELEASICLDGGASISALDFYYCAIDDVLHIYFDKDAVIEQIKADELDGEVEVCLKCTFVSNDELIEIEGCDTIEVFNTPSR